MQQPVRIIQVVNVRWFNATAWYALFLAKLLLEAGHQVQVVALPDTACFHKAQEMGLNPIGIDMNTAHPIQFAKAWSKIRALLRDFRPEIVNCHRGEGFALLALFKKHYGYTLVRTRGDQRPPHGGFGNRVLHNCLADAVIATCSPIMHYFADVLKTPAEKLYCIRGGVDTKKFTFSQEKRDTFRTQHGIKGNEKIVGLLGRFDSVKGHKYLISAMGIVQKNFPDARLLLAGLPKGVSQEEIELWVHEVGLIAPIYTGHCDDVVACICAMDVGIVASVSSETIARAALEIMSCGVPLLGTRVGVMPDLLQSEALVEPKDCENLAHKLVKIFTEDSWRIQLQKAQQHSMNTLSAEFFLTQTLQVYKNTLDIKK